ncbi:MAG TPA: hypothetical protein VKB88_46250 [Bryobacteraceae bacterium]|nr:hypothetical protein [Bryobacteraceae bacterium]
MVADWLQKHGVAAFLLKYRVMDTGTHEEFVTAKVPGARDAAQCRLDRAEVR